ncbi:alanine racemase [Tistrella mobilis]
MSTPVTTPVLPAAPAAPPPAWIEIDLDALAENHARLTGLMRAHNPAAEVAGVIKADGYGLGADIVGPALARAGAPALFVAHLSEGAALRRALRADPDPARHALPVYILNGMAEGERADFLAFDLRPVLNGPDDLDRWTRAGQAQGGPLPAALHIDTGMSRLGFDEAGFKALATDPARLGGVDIRITMSHLACADDPAHPLNRRQLDRFRAVAAAVGRGRLSLANSSGLFLGPDFHFDLGRPGVALYGVNPVPGRPNPMVPVVRLKARVLQVRTIDSFESVGYGAAARARPGMRVATLAIGYADGWPWSAAGKGEVVIASHRAPILGRVSMDLVTVDVSTLPEQLIHGGAVAELIGDHRDVDALAKDAGTIGYEILTRLGRRYARQPMASGQTQVYPIGVPTPQTEVDPAP